MIELWEALGRWDRDAIERIMATPEGQAAAGVWNRDLHSTPLLSILGDLDYPEISDFAPLFVPHSTPGQTDRNGRTALMLAAQNANLSGPHSAGESLIPLLMELDSPDTDDNTGMTALMHAALAGGEAAGRMVDMLLPVSDARLVDNMGETALMKAARSDSAESALALLPCSSANAVNKEGLTALMLAAHFHHPAAAAALVSSSHVDLSKCSNSGQTPLMIAAAALSPTHFQDIPREQNPAMLTAKALLPHFDPKATDPRGFNAFQHAIFAGNYVCADFLADFATTEQLQIAWRDTRGLSLDAKDEIPRVFALLETAHIRDAMNSGAAKTDSFPDAAEPPTISLAAAPDAAGKTPRREPRKL